MDIEKASIKAKRDWEKMQESKIPRIIIGNASCGKAAGSERVFGAIEKEIEERGLEVDVMQVGCIGLCYLEPLMDIVKPDYPRISYKLITPKLARELIHDFIEEENVRSDLAIGTIGEGTIEDIPRFFDHPMLKDQKRIVLRNAGLIDPENINHYLAMDGYKALHKSLQMKPEEIREEIKKSGLRGRGGAGFPTGLKWGFCAKANEKEKYLICNADEGDPGAFMDRSLLESDPHSVLEGMVIGAYAIGASQGYIYCRAEYPLAVKRLNKAIDDMKEYGFLGGDIMHSDFSFDITIKEGAGAFVCGEETALMASIEGKRGMPRPRPPFPANSGLWGKPTNINNVETLANVTAIMREGARWYSKYGTEKSKGTKTHSLAGSIKRTGLIEIPLGTPIKKIVMDIGGGIEGNKKWKGIQTGGPSGGFIPADLGSLSVDYESLEEAGSIMGSGGLVVIDEDTCMVDMAHYFLSFTRAESCGKCPPCRIGTKKMLDILKKIKNGKGEKEDIKRLERLADTAKKGSLCGLGQTAPNPVLTTLKYFSDEYMAHIEEKVCPVEKCNKSSKEQSK